MATRRLLLMAIGFLTLFIVIAGVGVAVLAYVGLVGRPGAAEQLLVVGNDQGLRLFDRSSDRLVAEDASSDLYRYPALAPDGRRIAYISQDAEGIALSSLDLVTGARTELYRSRESPPLYAAWAPDGRYISFLTNQLAGGLGTYIVAADGSGQAEQISNSPNSSYFAWQPGGEALLLHTGGGPSERGSLATYRPGQPQPLSQVENLGLFQAPAWSVDGSQFFYVAQPAAPSGLESVLTRVQADGSAPQVIVSEQQAAMIFLRAPGSDHIAYVTVSREGFGGLKVVDPAGGPARALSRPGEQVPAFFWSPDGSRIAYLTFQPPTSGQPAQLIWHVVERESGTIRDMASFTPSQAFAGLVRFFDAYALSFTIWSPSGRELVYGANDGVYLLDVENGAVERRADGVLGMWLPGR